MSRHQIGVATPLRPIQVATPKPGRDPPGGYPMSRHQFYVATSFLPTVGFPGRDTKNPGRDLPYCHPCRDLKMMSRLQAQSSQFQPGHDAHLWSLPQANQTRSRPQGHVATSSRPSQLPTPFFFFSSNSSSSLPCYS